MRFGYNVFLSEDFKESDYDQGDAGLTLSEKILAVHAGRDRVRPGDIVNVVVDVVLANDITAPLAIQEFRKIGLEKVFDPNKVVLVPDHFLPAKDVASAEQAKILRDFAVEQGLPHYFEVGRMGIEHVLLPEEGLVVPGEVIVGADSHTCTYGALGAFATGVGSTDVAAALAQGELWLRVPTTYRFLYKGSLKPGVMGKDLILFTIGEIGVDGALYRVMEFGGEVISALSMDGRFSMTNMAIEAGAKSGLIEADEKTIEFVEARAKKPFTVYRSDSDAEVEKAFEFDVSALEPQVACPHSPANVRSLGELDKVVIDQVVIGSCTNGRMEDLRVAAEVLRGRQVAKNVRLIVIPGTQGIYQRAMKEGILEILVEAGGVVSTPTCGPCLGGHLGVLARGERAVSTTNRNFRGRMGHPESEVFLSNPEVAAASAVAGRICGPSSL